MEMSCDIDEALELWQSKITCLKQHIYTKRVQFVEIQKLQENLTDNRCLYSLTIKRTISANNKTRYKVVHFIFSF